jgi:hypothetical protein
MTPLRPSLSRTFPLRHSARSLRSENSAPSRGFGGMKSLLLLGPSRHPAPTLHHVVSNEVRVVRNPSFALLAALLLAVLAFSLSGCGKNTNTEVDDPQLKPIQDMLNDKLPNGTNIGFVQNFLNARGYPIQSDHPRDAIVALVRHIDTDNGKLEPVTARVTFYFDPNGKLINTELARTFNQRIPQSPQSDAEPQSQPPSDTQPPSQPQSDQPSQSPSQQQ